MEFIERIQSAIRNSPSFPFVTSCEVACDNVLFDAASELYGSNPLEYWMMKEYGSGMSYWYYQVQHVFQEMARNGEL